MIPDAVALAGVLRSLNVEQAVIDGLLRVLEENAQGLEQARIHRLAIGPHAFGGSPKAADLGFHHQLAHHVIAETVLGVVTDLQRFREGVDTAVRLVDEADVSTAEALGQKARAVAVITQAAGSSVGDQRYDQARNEHVATQLGPAPEVPSAPRGDD